MKVSPSILSCDFSILKEEIQSVVEFSDFIHIDVMDGNFVNNITFGPGLIKDIRKHFKCMFDVHLMISKPLDYIEDFCNAGADIVTIHFECDSDVVSTIDKIKKLNKKVGLAINPSTNVDQIIHLLNCIDLILVMSVQPGFGGQCFNENCILKIKQLNEIRKKENYSFDIEVDGGINCDTVKLVEKAGADIVVAGSYIFNSKDRKKMIESLK